MTEISEKAIAAGIATSSTWPIRNETERAAYRQRVERLIEAVAPVICEEEFLRIRRGVMERLDPVELALSGPGHVQELLDTLVSK